MQLGKLAEERRLTQVQFAACSHAHASSLPRVIVVLTPRTATTLNKASGIGSSTYCLRWLGTCVSTHTCGHSLIQPNALSLLHARLTAPLRQRASGAGPTGSLQVPYVRHPHAADVLGL
jgi:hypothetical protein